MNKNRYKGMALSFLAAALWVSCEKQPEYVPYQPETEIGHILVTECDEVARVFEDTTFVVAVGVEETDIRLQTMTGYAQRIHILRIDTKTPGLKLKVTMPYDNDDVSAGYRRQTLTDMAAVIDEPRSRVVGMVNADFWDVNNPIKPRGPIHKDGVVISDKWNYSDKLPQQALSFVAIDNSGKMVIADRSEYGRMKNGLRQCTGAGVMMLVDGEYPDIEWPHRDPRTAIGYTEDGIIYFLTADGRLNRVGGSATKLEIKGLNYSEMGHIFKSLGCINAANLDGGGSAQMLIRNPLAQVFQIRNTPADGAERPVINGWAVVVDEP